jgi:hypothetical protein
MLCSQKSVASVRACIPKKTQNLSLLIASVITKSGEIEYKLRYEVYISAAGLRRHRNVRG